MRFIAAAMLCLFAFPALAFDRHDIENPWRTEMSAPSPYQKRIKTQKVHKSVKYQRKVAPDFGPTQVAAPARFIGGKLICAINVNAALAERGIQGTGSALAKSFLRWGYSTGPTPGAVAVYHRGRDPRSGHVAIVSRVEGGQVYIWNPTRRGWVEQVQRRAPIAYRAA